MRTPKSLPFLLDLAKTTRSLETWRLTHPDGSPYLDRTVLFGVDCLETHDPDQPYNGFFHRIWTADGDRHPHDHPWAWSVGIVLTGGYTETRTFNCQDGIVGWHDLTRTFRPGDLNVLRPGDYHRIVSVEPNTWTLFLTGPEVSDWGFLVDGVHVPHGEYFKRPDVQCMTHERIR